MSDVYRNPSKEPQDPKFEPRFLDQQDYPTTAGGPGGATINVENNERGILQRSLFHALATHKQAELGSDHRAQRQGIYRDQETTYGD